MAQENDLPGPPERRAFGVPRRREEITELLTEAYTRNDLEQGEFEQRVERAQHAQTIEELEALIADFPPEVKHRHTASGVPAHPTAAMGGDIAEQVAALDAMSAPTRFTLIGDQHTAILPSDPRVLRASAVIGDSHVDLRALSGMSGVFLLKVAAWIGDTKITVPRGTPVQIRLFTLIGDQRRGKKGDGFLSRLARRFGATPEKKEEPPGLPGPTVVVTGFRLIGDTVIIEE